MFDPVSKTVSINLMINRGITLGKLSQTANNRIFSEAKPENIIDEKFDIPISISLDNFKKEMYTRIEQKWGIDIPTRKHENGGTGALGSLSCSIDVEDKKERNRLTVMTLPNEESWDAATYLMNRREERLRSGSLSQWRERSGLRGRRCTG